MGIVTARVTAETRKRISDTKRRQHAERVAQSHRLKELHAKALQLLGACELILREREMNGDHDPLAAYYIDRIDELSTELRAEAIGATTVLSEAEVDAWSQVRS